MEHHYLASSLKQALIYHLANASIDTYPYPHVKGEQLIDGDLYKFIDKYWPEASDFSSWKDLFSSGKSVHHYESRNVIDIAKKIRLNPQERPLNIGIDFFYELHHKLSGPGFLQMILDKFDAFFKLHPLYYQIKPSIDFLDIELQVNEDLDGFSVNPHVQSLQELVVFILYLPKYGQNEHSGTSVFCPLPEFISESKRRLAFVHERNQFASVYTHPYKIGNFFGFFVCNNSWHGVDIVQDPYPRRSIYFSVKYKDAIMSKISKVRP